MPEKTIENSLYFIKENTILKKTVHRTFFMQKLYLYKQHIFFHFPVPTLSKIKYEKINLVLECCFQDIIDPRNEPIPILEVLLKPTHVKHSKRILTS